MTKYFEKHVNNRASSLQQTAATLWDQPAALQAMSMTINVSPFSYNRNSFRSQDENNGTGRKTKKNQREQRSGRGRGGKKVNTPSSNGDGPRDQARAKSDLSTKMGKKTLCLNYNKGRCNADTNNDGNCVSKKGDKRFHLCAKMVNGRVCGKSHPAAEHS